MIDEKDKKTLIYEIVSTIKNADVNLSTAFMDSILTSAELEDLANRWEICKKLDEGVSQRRISSNLDVSLCKITRGSRQLKRKGSPIKEFIGISKDMVKNITKEKSKENKEGYIKFNW